MSATSKDPIHILLIDARTPLRDALAKDLETLLDCVVTATDDLHADALELATSRRPQLIILELDLPRVGGLRLAQELRALGAPIVAMTSRVDDDAKRQASRLALADYLTKPIDFQQLSVRLRPLLKDWSSTEAQVQMTSDRRAPDRSGGSIDWVTRVLAPLVGSFCHDISSSFLAIHGNLQWLSPSDEDPDFGADMEETKTTALERISSAVQVAMQMVDDLDQISGFLRFGTEDIEMISEYALEAEIRAMFPFITSKRATLNIDTTRVHPRVRLPRSLLRHLLQPLVENSLDALATEESEYRPPTITILIETSLLEGYLRLVVTDNGPGWGSARPELWTRIHRKKANNRGFGLLNVNLIASTLGGRLALSDSQVRGAVVDILIPWRFFPGG